MPKLLEKFLENGAGRLAYVHPDTEVFVPKAWRLMLSLNADWARKALALDFSEVSPQFQKKGYVEEPGQHQDFTHFYKKKEGVIYVFDRAEGGLVRGIVQLARDMNFSLDTFLKSGEVTYHETNTDLKSQQDYLIEKIEEYVGVINRIIK